MPSPNKLYNILKQERKANQLPDNFWPLPDQLVGIEMEVEGADKIPAHLYTSMVHWKAVEDHSLRNGIEFILRNPTCGKNLTDAINEFFTNVRNYKVSSRTSTHLHLNMMDDEVDDKVLTAMIILYYATEDYFFSVAGNSRRWSGYCAPLEEAPVDILSPMIKEPFDGDALWKACKTPRDNADRYYALNLMSLARHGTLEFRHFQCAQNKDDLIKWVKLVMYLKRAAVKTVEDAVNVAEALSSDSAKITEFLNKYLPEIVDGVLNAANAEKISSKVAALVAYGQKEKSPNYMFRWNDSGQFGNWIKKLRFSRQFIQQLSITNDLSEEMKKEYAEYLKEKPKVDNTSLYSQSIAFTKRNFVRPEDRNDVWWAHFGARINDVIDEMRLNALMPAGSQTQIRNVAERAMFIMENEGIWRQQGFDNWLEGGAPGHQQEEEDVFEEMEEEHNVGDGIVPPQAQELAQRVQNGWGIPEDPVRYVNLNDVDGHGMNAAEIAYPVANAAIPAVDREAVDDFLRNYRNRIQQAANPAVPEQAVQNPARQGSAVNYYDLLRGRPHRLADRDPDNI